MNDTAVNLNKQIKMNQARNYGTLFQRMVEISSGKANLDVEQKLMAYFKVDSLRAAYTKVREVGREEEKKIAKLLRVIA